MDEWGEALQLSVLAFGKLHLPLTATLDQVMEKFGELSSKIHHTAIYQLKELERCRDEAVSYINLCEKVKAEKDFYVMVRDVSFPALSDDYLDDYLPYVCRFINDPANAALKLMARNRYNISLALEEIEDQLIKERKDTDDINASIIRTFVKAHLVLRPGGSVSTGEIAALYVKRYGLQESVLSGHSGFHNILKTVVLELFSDQPEVRYTQFRRGGVRYRGYVGIGFSLRNNDKSLPDAMLDSQNVQPVIENLQDKEFDVQNSQSVTNNVHDEGTGIQNAHTVVENVWGEGTGIQDAQSVIDGMRNDEPNAYNAQPIVGNLHTEDFDLDTSNECTIMEQEPSLTLHMSNSEPSSRTRLCRYDISRTLRCINFNGNSYYLEIYVTAFGDILTNNIDVISLFTERTLSKLGDHVRLVMAKSGSFKCYSSTPMLKDHIQVFVVWNESILS